MSYFSVMGVIPLTLLTALTLPVVVSPLWGLFLLHLGQQLNELELFPRYRGLFHALAFLKPALKLFPRYGGYSYKETLKLC